MKKIILDTNTLMAISQFKIDVFSEIDKLIDFKYELMILDKTIDELRKVSIEQKGKHRRAAELGLRIIMEKGIKLLKTEEGNVDDLLVKLAGKGAIIVTQDRELKDRIRESGGKLLTIRQKKKIVWG